LLWVEASYFVASASLFHSVAVTFFSAVLPVIFSSHFPGHLYIEENVRNSGFIYL